MNPTLITWTDAQRQQNFTHWLNGIAARLGLQPETLRPASSDSSSRRYFRIDSDRGPLVVMDAPPALEDCASYVRFAQLLASAELHVPSIFDWNEAHGFMLLSDMGPTTYLDRMRERPQDIEALCDDASRALVRLQGITRQPWIPAYDTARLTMEIGMFSEWYVSGFFRLTLDARQQARVQSAFDHLVRNALSEPQIMVHRDFHNRNLMAATPNPGILDFQGAVWGGASYDLVSMLRCAYIEWDESFQQDQAHRHWERARQAQVPMPEHFSDFWRDFEWSGLHRQLKVLGFFARLSVRDNRSEYLPDMPRVWGYASRTARRYPELAGLAHLLDLTDPSIHPTLKATAAAH